MSSDADFVHLHCHSDYSLLDGAAKTKALAKTAKENGQIAVALTDHGSVSGVLDFWKACDKQGIKPIIGCEAYLAPGLDEGAHLRRGVEEDGSVRKDERGRRISHDYDHFTLIAKNLQGWINLRKLSSIASLEGFYSRPRMSWDLLTKHHEGLIALSGCLSGQLSNEIKIGNHAAAEAHARRWKELFGDDYYAELMPVIPITEGSDSELASDQALVNDGCLAIAKKLGLKTVATADVHYIDRTDAEIQEVKICVKNYKTLAENRSGGLNMSPVFYFKKTEEMRRYFSGYPEAILNTREIAEKCEKIKVFPGKFYMPKFLTPDGSTTVDYFRRLCREGLIRRYGPFGSWDNAARLEYEMACIEKLGFVDYFLITSDFTSWARKHGVPVGPGRGSAAGSITSYCLGITNIDPIRYDLLFERFLNPDRVSMPDIDIDFDDRGRGRVIEYVRQKYGEKCVAQIITFGESKAKSSVRDVGRVLEMPQAEVNKIAKLIPEVTKPTDKDKTILEESLEIPELRAMYDTDTKKKKLFDLALGLEGLYRSEGKHAAGVVIGDRDLMELIPLTMVGKRDDPSNGKKGDASICTAFSMEQVEEVGLVKLDFLGLRTITQIYDTVALIKHTTGVDVDPDTIPVRDNHSMESTRGAHECRVHGVVFEKCDCCEKTLRVFRQVAVNGVFQVEGSGIRKLLKQMCPDRFDDLVAIMALYRPGPLGSGMDQTYVKRKNGEEPVEYEHPRLETITKKTYGVWCYQEQLMQLSVALAGFTLPQADELRKATAKKKPEAMAKIRDKFVPGCIKHADMTQEQADKLWEKIVFFSEYSFNLSHSAAYGLISWHTGWLKANYPVEFMAALLTSWCGDTDKLSVYIDEVRRLGIPIESPDVNLSEATFTVHVRPNGPSSIVYGLDALKGVGAETVRSILETRRRVGRFRSIFHFCEEVDLKAVPGDVIDTLAKAGAFRSTGATRGQILEPTTYYTRKGRGALKEVTENAIEASIRCAKLEKKDRLKGQNSLFGPAESDDALPDIPEWEMSKILSAEKDALGLYLSGHPLDKYMTEISEYATVLSSRASEVGSGHVYMGGVIRSVRLHLTAGGKEMAFLSLEDTAGVFDGVLFPRPWESLKEIVRPGAILFLGGTIDQNREPPSLQVDDAIPIGEANGRLSASKFLRIVFFKGLVDKALSLKVDEVMKSHPGNRSVTFCWKDKDGTGQSLLKAYHRRVEISPALRQELRDVLGDRGEVLIGRK